MERAALKLNFLPETLQPELLGVAFEELGVFLTAVGCNLKTWSAVNKLKQDAFYQENTQRRKESREKLHK